MGDILERFISMDALSLLFLGGSLIFLWGLYRVLKDDLDLSDKPAEESDVEQPPVEPSKETGEDTKKGAARSHRPAA